MNKRGMDNLKDRLMLNKRGELKYDLLIAFILGLAVVGISLAFLLPSFFSGEIDRQTCKESILLRASIPSANLGLMNLASIREQFPLKCKSEVVNIDYEDNAKAEKIIAETMMSCWVLYGEGKLNLFPQSKFSGNSYCSACARIHIDSKVQEYYKNNPINIYNALYNQIAPGTKGSYMDYFQRNDASYSAFAYVDPKQPWADSFNMNQYEKGVGQIVYDLAKFSLLGFISSSSKNTLLMQLPKSWSPSQSQDLLVIIYQTVLNYDSNEISQFGKLHMAFLTSDKIGETSKQGLWGLENKGAMCENWEGTPV